MAKRTSVDADADGAATSEELEHKKKHQRVDEVSAVKEDADMEDSGPTTADDNGVSNDTTKHQQSLCCSGCGISDRAANGSLLLFDDPEEDNKEEDDQLQQPGDKTGNNEEKR